MNPRAVITVLAAGRLALGAGLVAKPRQLGTAWIGEDAKRPTAAVPMRAVGARDMALALGTLAAQRTGGPLKPWLLCATLADATDLVATFAAGRAVPRSAKALIGLLAGGAIAQQLALARRVDA
ncbi:MAG TPA: hypothetical protein VFU94_07835 [Conexibacter sp.]|nr:hypothetical protein [Conexibacter sp.]